MCCSNLWLVLLITTVYHIGYLPVIHPGGTRTLEFVALSSDKILPAVQDFDVEPVIEHVPGKTKECWKNHHAEHAQLSQTFLDQYHVKMLSVIINASAQVRTSLINESAPSCVLSDRTFTATNLPSESFPRYIDPKPPVPMTSLKLFVAALISL